MKAFTCDGCGKPLDPDSEPHGVVEVLRSVGGREVRHYHDSLKGSSCLTEAGLGAELAGDDDGK